MTNQEHINNIDFLARFKEANRNTVREVSSYDPAKKMWVLKPVVIDENAYRFAEENILSEVQNRRRKTNGVLNASGGGKRNYTKATNVLRNNVVELHSTGKKPSEIAEQCGISRRSVYRILKNENNN